MLTAKEKILLPIVECEIELVRLQLAHPEKFTAPAGIPIPAGERQKVDIQSAAKMLGRVVGTMYHLTSKNKIPFHKEGRVIYFYTDDLREWAKENTGKRRKRG